MHRPRGVLTCGMTIVTLAVLASLGACQVATTPNDHPLTSPVDVEKPAATSAVTIENFAFTPASLTVKVGTTVTWTNKDGTTHTVTSKSGPEPFDSGRLATGKTFSVTFTKVGTYTYYCQIHTSMMGTIVVE